MLIELLDRSASFSYKIHYHPPKVPGQANRLNARAHQVIAAQMQTCDVLLALNCAEPGYRPWIEAELHCAHNGLGTALPVVVVQTLGAPLPDYLQAAADRVAIWNAVSIAAAIRDVCFSEE